MTIYSLRGGFKNLIQKCKKFAFNGLTVYVHDQVYDPAEDTFQLIESLQVESDNRILELGAGCGIIALYCAFLGAKVVCSDINPYAVKLTEYNYSINKDVIKGSIDVRYGDLFSSLKQTETFDIIVFNPPYLPSAEGRDRGKKDSSWFDISIYGGSDGLDVTSRFIQQLPRFLTEKGSAFFMFSSHSNKRKLVQNLKTKSLDAKVVLSRFFDDERLDVYQVKKKLRS